MSVIEPRTAIVTIYTGDYLSEIQHLERQAEASKNAAGPEHARTLGEAPEYLEIAERHAALVREAKQSAIHVKVTALGRKMWKTLCAEHPPRTESAEVTATTAATDAAVGVNEETFKDALVAASIVSPPLSEADLENLSDIDFDRIYLTAFSLNRSVVADPKASLVSRLTPKSDETSS